MNNFKEEKKECLRLLKIAEDLSADGVAPDEIARYLEEKKACKFTDPYIHGIYINFISSLL